MATTAAEVRAYLARFGKDQEIMESEESTATVALAAAAFHVAPEQIAKTLAFKRDEGRAFLVVFAGDARVDNRKWKAEFGVKASMLSAEATEAITGFAPGGVCPFALPTDGSTALYLDVSLQRFETVFPACGTANTGIPLTPAELFEISGALGWVDVAKGWRPEE